VNFIGEPVDAWHMYNVINTFQVGGEPHYDDDMWSFEPLAGSHVVKDCIFDNVGASVKYNSVNGRVSVKNNKIMNNVFGIWLYYCDTLDSPKREIKQNEISGTIFGIEVENSNSFIIKNNKVTNGLFGIDLIESDDNLIMNNYLSGNIIFDLSWDGYGDNTWKNNVYTTKSWT
jgi:parallel beta-helix repeat protein